MTKLENLSNNAMLELNGWRTIYWLPQLTTDALNNYSNRVDLYRNWGPTTTSNTQSNISYNSVSTSLEALIKKYQLK
jgi:hypothetical protein